jgi:uncharacterized tellurite resistance protein B-like protein
MTRPAMHGEVSTPFAQRGERHIGEKATRDVIGGALKPADPRRFLVEAMMGAVYADGAVDARELAVLDAHVQEHDLFQGLNASASRAMIELARDAVEFAGNSLARIPAIARGLPSRIHRLTAYAMACEVVKADGAVAEAEVTYLETLRQHLRVGAEEALTMFSAIDEKRLGRHLDDRVRRIRGLAPIVAEMFALRALLAGRLDDNHKRALTEFFLAMPDLAALPADVERLITAAFARAKKPNLDAHAELGKLSAQVVDGVDRWWMVVYALAAEPQDFRDWRLVMFVQQVGGVFGLGTLDMDLAAYDAQTLPVTLSTK